MRTGEDASEKEIYASWAIFILIMLMIVALFTSYFLQQRKVTAIHETVASIFAGVYHAQRNSGVLGMSTNIMARHGCRIDTPSRWW